MNIVVRKITPEDYPQTIDVIKQSNSQSLGKIYPKKLIEDFLKKYNIQNFRIKAKKVEYFVAEETDSHQILGVIGLKNNEIRTFFVDPKQQGKGIGRMLYDYLEKIAKEKGMKELITEGSPLGQPIYEHLGFRKIETIQKERVGIKYEDAYMKKSLV